MSRYQVTVPLQATYTDEVLEENEVLTEVKEKFPTLEIEVDEDEVDETGFFTHTLIARDPMDIVGFLMFTGDLSNEGLWTSINEIEIY